MTFDPRLDPAYGLMRIASPRLELISATTALLEMELASPQKLGVALGAQVPDGWPPGEYDENAIRWLLDRLKAQPEAAGWFAWYALLKAETGPGAKPHLVAAGGYTGPSDENGQIEIGYSVVPAFGKRGIATEMVAALVQHAFADPRITRVIAHTFPTNVASIRVLEKNGFTLEGPGAEEGTIRYARGLKENRANGG
ncbi:MAG: GNAT family N-acetyltransferase [Ignavibacteriae bacterium]|nr:GNAT family N-acetyltransferase [Ignavibacteriota bacterium]